MITWEDIYIVISAVVPLYVTLFLAYGSVKWWKIFSPEQCAGINKFVVEFAVPLMSFEYIYKINPYELNFPFIAADAISKAMTLLALGLWAKCSHRGSFDWVITLFSLSTMPNLLVIGIPIVKAMYGDSAAKLTVQAVVMQSLVWYSILLFLYEYRSAKMLYDNVPSVVKEGENPSLSGDARVDASISLKVITDPEQPNKEVNVYRDCNSEDKLPTADGEFVIEKEDPKLPESVSKATTAIISIKVDQSDQKSPHAAAVMITILGTVWRKVVRNPNFYSSVIAIIWALIAARWHLGLPPMVQGSVTILSNTSLGMAMFSLGLFMALQPRIIACGASLALLAMLMRFLTGPAFMAIASIAAGLRGTVLHLSIVQAALPQGIVPFVFAREYNLHSDILSTAVIFCTIISLPITVAYYVLFEV